MNGLIGAMLVISIALIIANINIIKRLDKIYDILKRISITEAKKYI